MTQRRAALWRRVMVALVGVGGGALVARVDGA